MFYIITRSPERMYNDFVYLMGTTNCSVQLFRCWGTCTSDPEWGPDLAVNDGDIIGLYSGALNTTALPTECCHSIVIMSSFF